MIKSDDTHASASSGPSGPSGAFGLLGIGETVTDVPQDEGIVLTPEALVQALRLQRQLLDQAKPASELRLYLDGKGCDGFYYGVSFDDSTPSDLRFPQAEGLTLICDPDTLDFVRGSVITWVDDERGQGFLVENPYHKRYRGKFYKKKSWQDKLLAKKNATLQDEN